MAQLTSSAPLLAIACIAGCGRYNVEFGGKASLSEDFNASYVVKNAPEEGIVMRMIEPTPW
jgi:hypothetical protein